MKLLAYGYTVDRPAKLLGGTVDYRAIVAQQPSAQSVGPVNDWVFQFVVDDRRTPVIYMTSPLFSLRSFQDKLPVKARHRPWLKFDVAGLLHSGGGQVGPALRSQLAAVVPGFQSPLAAFAVLATNAPAVSGSDEIGGVHTRRFQTTGDLTHTTALGSVAAKFAQVARPPWVAQVWVDDHGLIRRARFTSAAIAALGHSSVVITCDVAGPLPNTVVSVPPSGEVVDAATLGP